ncbi:hypothetical protein GC170_13175 [bacterium]|nr:hypothetical protein [bacterium]
MRLTLRTLMAWMDDTLPPKDVRRIGRQLERSKFSQDLSRRIRRVLRQRRLTVPGMSSNQQVDANIVAAYLDNNLPGEATSTYESLCLNSDVHLAEVAASHQILSVLDQPCSIEPEIYASMYRIVKAPESRTPSDRPLPQRITSEPRNANPISHEGEYAAPIWPEPRFVRNSRKFVAAILLVACTLAFASLALDRIVGLSPQISTIANETGETIAEAESSLRSGEDTQDMAIPPATQPVDRAEEAGKATADLQAPGPASALPASGKPDSVITGVEAPAPATDAPKGTETAPKEVVNSKEGVSAPPENREGKRRDFIALPEIATIADSTILFTAPKDDAKSKTWAFWKKSPNLPVYLRFAGADSAKFVSGSLNFVIEPGSLLELPEVGPPQWLAEQAEAISTAAGEFRFRTGSGREFDVSFPDDAKFRIESRTGSAAPGKVDSNPQESSVVVRSLKGTLTVTTGRTEMKVAENRSLRIDKTGPPVLFEERHESLDPNVPVNPGSTLVNRMMRRYLGTNRPLATSIIDAESDDLPEVRDLALKIALWIDREDIVTGVLTDLEKPELRKSAILAVKEVSARGEDSARRAILGCVDELALADPDAELLQSLFSVPAVEESLDRKKLLVKSLEHDARLIRQLALQRLMQISGRDSMGFDPDEPTAKGIEAWRSWIGMDFQGSRP